MKGKESAMRCSVANFPQTLGEASKARSVDMWKSELRAYLIHDFSSFACRYAASNVRNAIPGHETTRGVEALAHVCVFGGLSNKTRRATKAVDAGVDVIEASEEILGILVCERNSGHLCDEYPGGWRNGRSRRQSAHQLAVDRED